MTLPHIRLINSLFILCILEQGHPELCWYLLVMHLSLEFLNRQTLYLQQSFRRYNSLFVLYEIVLLARLRGWFFDPQTEWMINVVEHTAFAIVICIKLYIYTAITVTKKISRSIRAVLAIAAFNCIGVANEIFQNHLAGRNWVLFIPDSIKDMQVNAAGALVFAAAVFYRIRMLQYQHSGSRSF